VRNLQFPRDIQRFQRLVLPQIQVNQQTKEGSTEPGLSLRAPFRHMTESAACPASVDSLASPIIADMFFCIYFQYPFIALFRFIDLAFHDFQSRQVHDRRYISRLDLIASSNAARAAFTSF